MSKCVRKLTGHQVASGKWIASVSFWTAAYRIVIDHLTFSVLTTSAWTRILTFITKTCLCQWTLGTHYAFWSTGRRTTHETTLTRTNCMIVHHSADAVWTARRRCARLYPWLWQINIRLISLLKVFVDIKECKKIYLRLHVVDRVWMDPHWYQEDSCTWEYD